MSVPSSEPGFGSAATPLLELSQVSKHFTGTRALYKVSLDIRAGEIHALLGENGAGKSTLIKILAGVHRPDEGVFRLRGEEFDPASISGSGSLSFIHQELGLVDSMSVAENIAIIAGYPRRRFGLISWGQASRQASQALKTLDSTMQTSVDVSRLSAAEKTIVAVARALVSRCDVLVLDEPTATLPEADVAELFKILNRLRNTGVGIIYVTHRLDEVFRLADRVTVLKDGEVVASRLVNDVTHAQLMADIVGRSLNEVYVAPARPRDDVVLNLRDFAAGMSGPVSLSVRAGEIVGLVGLRGAGHHEIGRGIAGDLRGSGEMKIQGLALAPRTPRQALRNGIGLLPSKRAEEGLAPMMTVQENLFPNPDPVGRQVLLLPGRERALARRIADQFSIRPRDPGQMVVTLSGGNQQKVLIARVFRSGDKLLVLQEPTSGVDIGAKADIYALIGQMSREGRAIIVISSDFEEVAYVCHRALVFDRGSIAAELSGDELTVQNVTRVASGVR